MEDNNSKKPEDIIGQVTGVVDSFDFDKALNELDQPYTPGDEPEIPQPVTVTAKPIRPVNHRLKGTGVESLRERRKMVLMLSMSGLAHKEIAQAINESGRFELVITPSMVLKDIEKLQEEFKTRTSKFDSDDEMGRTIIQYDLLYEQAMQQYFASDGKGPAKQKFLELAKDAINSKHKFLENVGLVDKAISKKEVTHKHDIISKYTPEQIKQLEDLMFNMAVQQQAPGNKLPDDTTADDIKNNPDKLN